MGGVAGHMSHLYDNPSLSFSKMKDILSLVSEGEIEAEEKVDGQNLFLSFSLKDGKAKGARNKSNLRSGGMNASDLAAKFAGRGNLEKTFTEGFASFEKALKALTDREKLYIFGPDADVWYNAEIMDPGSPNVINYDNKVLKIHDRGHFRFDKNSGEKSDVPVEKEIKLLDKTLFRMQSRLGKDDFQLARSAIIQLKKLEDDVFLKEALSRLDKTIRDTGLSESDTVGQYVYNRLYNGLDTDISTPIKKNILSYLLKLPDNIGLRELKKKLAPEEQMDLLRIIDSKPVLLKQAIEPIENIIHDFAVEILKSLDSIFIADNDSEVKRIRKELSDAVNQMIETGEEDPESMEILQFHLNKIKDMGKITTPMEGIVFDHDGHTYKFTGNFAPLNQILGLFKYGRKTKPLVTSESKNNSIKVLSEQDGKRIALFPGKFKPPHRGHFDYVNKIARRSDVDEVIVLISPVDYPEVNNNQSLDIWNEYLKNGESNITAKIAEYRSPVQAVYEFVADPKNATDGDTVLLIKSSKDMGDTRFDRAQSYAERHNPGVNVEDIVEDPIQSRDGTVYSARDMRKAISDNDRKSFISYTPPSADGDALWKTLTRTTESLNSLIDNTIEEISTMAGGSVSGYTGNIGVPNVYSRSKTVRPKVKRAKRQRRR
jgi:hypothetical protein